MFVFGVLGTKKVSMTQTLISAELRRSLKVMVFQRQLREAGVGDRWVKLDIKRERFEILRFDRHSHR